MPIGKFRSIQTGRRSLSDTGLHVCAIILSCLITEFEQSATMVCLDVRRLPYYYELIYKYIIKKTEWQLCV